MFCTACAAANPRTLRRCTACGEPLRSARTVSRRSRGQDWATRISATLAVALPLAMLLAVGSYWAAEQNAKAAAYAGGARALTAGDPEAAIAAFTEAGDYRDAPARAAATRTALDAIRGLYQAGVLALGSGDLDGAVDAFLPVVRAFPGFRDAAALLAQARDQRLTTLTRELEAALDRGDWLTAERAAAALAAADPGNPAHAELLTAIRRDHAPLLFGRDGALVLIGPDGEDERVVLSHLPAAWPVWSPDRTRIAFVSPGDFGQLTLYVINLDGSGLVRLGDWLRPYEPPVWSPDGTRIAYVSTARLDPARPDEAAADAALASSALTIGQPLQPLPEPMLRVVEVATGLVTDPARGLVTAASYPTWSPTGDRLAFVSRASESGDQRPTGRPVGAVYVVTLASGELTTPGRDRIENPWRIAWSPTEEAIVVWTRRPGQDYDAERTPLYLLDAETGAATDLNPDRDRVTMPTWSPNGRSLAYVEDGDRLRVRSLDGDDRTIRLAAPGTDFLSWSPDGTAIVIAGGGRPTMISRLTGFGAGQVRSLPLAYDTNRREAAPPQWSPLNPVPDPRASTVAGTAHDR